MTRACQPKTCTHRKSDGSACRPCRDAAFADWSLHPTCQAEVKNDMRHGRGTRWCGAPACFVRRRVVLGMFEEVKTFCRAHRCAGAKLDRGLWAHGCIWSPSDALGALAPATVRS